MDLDQLAAVGLFGIEYNAEGNPLVSLTRNGLRYLETIGGKAIGPVANGVANDG